MRSITDHLGKLFSWATIYTGTLADAEVGRTLCDPTVLEDHEYYGFTTAYFFSGISVGFPVKSFFTLLNNYRKVANVLVLVLMLAGNGYLTYSAHLGANVVY
ncbi:MAG: hypothetical protein BRD49_00675 [Bacteroidetes bacterium SW_10_40_5]|nr:MAG: hypothetical protein BRD49_00675 [Bacteroidetes bacterium SW_10_40_5]